jgi:starch synthase
MTAAAHRVLFVASEIFPMAKTGGLGDVAGALPAALARVGVDVRLMMPAYPSALQIVKGLAVSHHFDDVAGFGPIDILAGRTPSGLRVWLVFSRALYERPGDPYHDQDGNEWPDNLERFALLCQAAARIATQAGEWRPSIVHLNDWHTALVPSLLGAMPQPHPASLLTIHNAMYQGEAPQKKLREFGVPAERLERLGSGKLSFLALGIQEASLLNAVSPTYAREIQTPEFGCGLEDLFAARSRDLCGILNGVDYEVWDPRNDANIAHNYSERNLAGKAACKAALLEELNLDRTMTAPLIGVVSRLTRQKGLDLLTRSAEHVLTAGARLAVLGVGEKAIEQSFRDLATRHPDRVAVRIQFDESLAHRIVAGADLFAMPSRFEPSGLNQMYSLRYGTVPIVTAVGGLADSVTDSGERGIAEGVTTGFVLTDFSPDAFAAAVRKAVSLFASRHIWQALQRNGMRQDFSWDRSAKAYAALYDRLNAVPAPT